jgi:beta-xylosidase
MIIINSSMKFHKALLTHIYTADPSAHVFEGQIYIYPSHDIVHKMESNDNGDQYAMEDYHVLSLKDFNSECIDHGEALHLRDIPWASKQLWAPDAAYKNNKYYLFFPARDQEGLFRIGVAVSESPVGPFKAEESYIPGSFSIDPVVFVDEDSRVYMYFGGLWGGQLEKWQHGTYKSERIAPSPEDLALGPQFAELSDDLLSFKTIPRSVSIIDEDGKPLLAGDEDRRFFEGAWVHKYNDMYYLSYSTGTTHCLVYAISSAPEGPFVFKGTILPPVIGWTTHHSIIKVEEQWYLFYHDSSLSGGINHQRCVKCAELHYNTDGTIQKISPYLDIE